MSMCLSNNFLPLLQIPVLSTYICEAGWLLYFFNVQYLRSVILYFYFASWHTAFLTSRPISTQKDGIVAREKDNSFVYPSVHMCMTDVT